MNDAAAFAETVVVTLDGKVAVVTLDGPTTRNALSLPMQQQLVRALTAADRDPDVRAVVLTGAGDKVFAAGADVRRLKQATALDGLDGTLQRTFDTVEALSKPVIAAVNGWALGGGCELALACDIRIASDTARFGLPETGLGVIPGAGGTQRLTRIVGLGRATDLVLTGRILSAAEALDHGLVTRVVAHDRLLEEALQVASHVAARAPMAMRLARVALQAAADADLRTGLLVEKLAQSILHTTADKQEGIGAFLEKRPATFEGK